MGNVEEKNTSRYDYQSCPRAYMVYICGPINLHNFVPHACCSPSVCTLHIELLFFCRSSDPWKRITRGNRWARMFWRGIRGDWFMSRMGACGWLYGWQTWETNIYLIFDFNGEIWLRKGRADIFASNFSIYPHSHSRQWDADYLWAGSDVSDLAVYYENRFFFLVAYIFLICRDLWW